MDQPTQWDLSGTKPPETLSELQAALWWLAKGELQVGAEWENAHTICQRHEGSSGHDLVHGLAHWIEGDEGNSDYWYRRAGATRMSEDAKAEWTHLTTVI